MMVEGGREEEEEKQRENFTGRWQWCEKIIDGEGQFCNLRNVMLYRKII